MSRRNYLDLLDDLEQELKLGHVAEHVMAIAVSQNVLKDNLFELAEREVKSDGTTKCVSYALLSR